MSAPLSDDITPGSYFIHEDRLDFTPGRSYHTSFAAVNETVDLMNFHSHAGNWRIMSCRRNRAVFLDRDGVINVKAPEDVYIKTPSEFHFLPGVFEGLSILRDLGFLLIVVTNQRGIARRMMTEEDLDRVHDYMIGRLREHDVELEGVYHCPHEKYELCPCRKPRPFLLLKAARESGVCLPTSYMVGDSDSDVAAGRLVGARTVRIAKRRDSSAHMTFPTLAAFARFVQSLRTG
jgi:D-glycero-D-manno-heptose 1,7-bisphosphate phosphatase